MAMAPRGVAGIWALVLPAGDFAALTSGERTPSRKSAKGARLLLSATWPESCLWHGICTLQPVTNFATTNPTSEIENLRQEIAQLKELQNEALRTAVFVGMSREEAGEYDARHARIVALTAQLRALPPVQQNS